MSPNESLQEQGESKGRHTSWFIGEREKGEEECEDEEEQWREEQCGEGE